LAYDNTCKYLAEEYPADFVGWLLSDSTSDIQVLKTELSLDPIRADSVIFIKIGNKILHLEFQTQPQSNPPIDFRMLDYYTRLKREYGCQIEQVVIFLQQTSSEIVFKQEYLDTNTRHGYRTMRMWEENPAPLLANPALLPFATLARSNSPNALLEQVAARVDMIEETDERRNISACAEVLAGLRFAKNLIQELFREEVMQESVIYQDILQKGEQRGKQQGKQEEALALIMRLLPRRIGAIAPDLEERIRGLSLFQLEELAEALLDFSAANDLTVWLDANS
jgi:predicted transposase/invertase (TIGR01784 family)